MTNETPKNEKARKLIGQAVIDGLIKPHPVGGWILPNDYNQINPGDYHQSDGGSHNQGGGSYWQGPTIKRLE